MLDNLLQTENAFPNNITAYEGRAFNNEYDDPIVNFANNLLHEAALQSASDIHIEPFQHACRIRYRQDGLLIEMTKIPSHLALRVISRLKIMANLNISETRLPQDGRFQFQLAPNKPIDVRINTCPTLFGEKIVLRLLDINKTSLSIQQLGLTADQLISFTEKISQPHGMIIVTGPTGSGKTVTLYSALRFLNVPDKNISTVEDPIEIQLDGINQITINPKIGLDFENCLRTILRQDPDIIMIGEIRDKPTAKIVVQAALTGHLVFTTLHTNNALETLTRLRSIDIQVDDLSNSLSLIVAQRLVRILCHYCKKPSTFQGKRIYEASQCPKCITGYKGRMGIYELMTFKTGSSDFIPLKTIALQKVFEGTTSMEEITRVIS